MKRAKLKPARFSLILCQNKLASSGATTSRIVSAQAKPHSAMQPKDLLLCLQSLRAALKTPASPACSVRAIVSPTGRIGIGATAGKREQT